MDWPCCFFFQRHLSSGTQLTQDEALKIFTDVCQAVARLHHRTKPITHRDLKVRRGRGTNGGTKDATSHTHGVVFLALHTGGEHLAGFLRELCPLWLRQFHDPDHEARSGEGHVYVSQTHNWVNGRECFHCWFTLARPTWSGLPIVPWGHSLCGHVNSVFVFVAKSHKASKSYLYLSHAKKEVEHLQTFHW